MGFLSRLWGLFAAPEPQIKAPPPPPRAAAPARATRKLQAPTRPASRPEEDLPSDVVSVPDHELEPALQEELRARCEQLLPKLSDEPDLSAILRGLCNEVADALPQIPAAAQKGLSLTVNPNVQVNDLVKVFEGDPSLAQALLKTANSSYYAAASPCTTIDNAVVKLGRRGLRNVLLMQVMKGLVCRPGAAFGDLPAKVWTHMSESAPLARRLAPVFGGNPEEAFAVALLHDAGKLVLLEAASALRRKRRREVEVNDRSLIPEVLDLLHEPLGGLAVSRWGFPPEVARVVAHHHRSPMPEHDSPLCEAVFLADAIQHAGDLSALDLDTVWAQGQLSGSPVRVTELPTDTFSRRAVVVKA